MRLERYGIWEEALAMKLCAFFVNELKSLYQAEQQSLQAIAKMAEQANSDKLSDLFNAKLSTVQEHMKRLEQVFGLVEVAPQAKRSEGMEGLIAELNTVSNESTGSAQFDAALIACAQKIIHYKIVSYGCLCSWSYVMDLPSILEPLKASLMDNKSFDAMLTQMAQNEINVQAFLTAP